MDKAKTTSTRNLRQICAWLWHLWKGYRLQVTLNATIGLMGVGCSLAAVWAMQHAIDIATGNDEGLLWAAVGLMAAVMAAEFGLQVAHVWIKNLLGVKSQNALQLRLMNRLMRSEWQPEGQMHSGDIVNRLEQDVQQVVNFLTETIPSTLSSVAMFLGAFCYLLSMDRILAVITVAILPLFLPLSRFYVHRMRQYTRSIRESDSHIQSLMQEALQHNLLVKTMQAEPFVNKRVDTAQGELRHKVKKRTAFSVMANLLVTVGFSSGYLIAFFWGALRMQSGTLTFGGMAAFLQLVNRIQTPARSLTRLIPAFVSVMTASERLMQLEQNDMEEQGEDIWLDAPCGVKMDHVTYHYATENAQHVISDLTFDFRPGTITAVMGPTGTGKTTLLRLLLHLVVPGQGAISVYDSHGNSQPLSPRHRCNFVYVPQGNTLLSGTLRDNLRIGNPQATDQQMSEALRRSCADFVDELPEGLDTPLSEHGIGLSEGQAQRIAIARALLRPGSVMLLDEATSALDAATEQRLIENLLSHGSHTVIFVTHRETVTSLCQQTLRI